MRSLYDDLLKRMMVQWVIKYRDVSDIELDMLFKSILEDCLPKLELDKQSTTPVEPPAGLLRHVARAYAEFPNG